MGQLDGRMGRKVYYEWIVVAFARHMPCGFASCHCTSHTCGVGVVAAGLAHVAFGAAAGAMFAVGAARSQMPIPELLAVPWALTIWAVSYFGWFRRSASCRHRREIASDEHGPCSWRTSSTGSRSARSRAPGGPEILKDAGREVRRSHLGGRVVPAEDTCRIVVQTERNAHQRQRTGADEPIAIPGGERSFMSSRTVGSRRHGAPGPSRSAGAHRSHRRRPGVARIGHLWRPACGAVSGPGRGPR